MRRSASRRGFLIGLAGVPALIAAAKALSAARGSIAAMRPGSRGTSAGICASCGARGHTMLDPACPASRKVV
jgi:hypothetical protein